MAKISKYEVIRTLGAGGMGEVVLARDPVGRYVAIKLIRMQLSGNIEIRRRFEREVRIQQNLRHPAILPVIDAGEMNGVPYFVMPYIECISLSARLRQRHLTLLEALVVMRSIGSALSYAHARNILHRDVKPGNILIHPQGHAYLTDFGIATDPTPHITPDLRTSTTQMMGLGTEGYAAPELRQGMPASRQSDIYSLGVTLYEMLTGKRMALALVQDTDPWAGLPVEVAHIIHQAAQHSPARRYQTVDEMLRVLEQAVTSSVPTGLRTPPTPITGQAAGTARPSPPSFPSVTSSRSGYQPPLRPSSVSFIKPVAIIMITGVLVFMIFLLLQVYTSPPTATLSTASTRAPDTTLVRLPTFTPFPTDVVRIGPLPEPMVNPTALPASTHSSPSLSTLPAILDERLIALPDQLEPAGECIVNSETLLLFSKGEEGIPVYRSADDLNNRETVASGTVVTTTGWQYSINQITLCQIYLENGLSMVWVELDHLFQPPANQSAHIAPAVNNEAAHYLNLAHEAFAQRQYMDALNAISNASAIDPNNPEIYLLAGDVYYEISRNDPRYRVDARQSYEIYLRLAGSNTAVRAALRLDELQ